MKLWLITPVKPFEAGKSRLAEVLSTQERTSLNQQLLINLLTVVQRSAVCSGMIVVSQSNAVLALADRYGAIPLLEHIHDGLLDGLNPALQQARMAAIARGAEAILVLPADLPWIEPKDLLCLYKAGKQHLGVTIVPSRDNGTNALLLHPPMAIDFAFGLNSFEHHQELARAAGLRCRVEQMPNLAVDIDKPQDLALLLQTACS